MQPNPTGSLLDHVRVIRGLGNSDDGTDACTLSPPVETTRTTARPRKPYVPYPRSSARNGPAQLVAIQTPKSQLIDSHSASHPMVGMADDYYSLWLLPNTFGIQKADLS